MILLYLFKDIDLIFIIFESYYLALHINFNNNYQYNTNFLYLVEIITKMICD